MFARMRTSRVADAIAGVAIGVAVILICVSLLTGCGPSKPDIQTTIAQTIQATNLSLLSQVDWQQITTALSGRVGPDFWLEVEAYIKQSAGLVIRGHGGTLSFSTQGSGTGGGDNTAAWPELVAVQQRWERADNAGRADLQQWTDAVLDALLRGYERQQTQEGQNAETAKRQNSEGGG